MPFFEDETEFAIRQKCGSIMIRDSLVFSNGCQWRWGRGEEPEEGSEEMKQVKYKFHTASLEKMVRNYRSVKSNIVTQAQWNQMGAGPPPPPGGAEHLEMLAEEIEAKQEQVVELHAQLQPVKKYIEYHDGRAKQREQAVAMVQELFNTPQF